MNFQLFAEPWWVNLLVLIPIGAYFIFRKKGLQFAPRALLASFIFGVAFGFVESSVVVYLRSAVGMFSGGAFPSIELFREAATMVMLVSVAFLAAKPARERWAIFLWTFATWDLFYYVFLWILIRWPSSLLTADILFLIPVPWYAQVWFPILVDLLTMVAIMLSKIFRHNIRH